MSNTSWPTVTDAQILASAMGVTFTSAQTAAFSMISASIIKTIEQKTHRTFIPLTEVRQFDGSGTGTLEVEELITINTIQFVGFLGQTPGLVLDNTHVKKRSTFPKTIIEIYQGGVPAFQKMWASTFPEGRSNIEINALWGFDTTIPDDLWLAVNMQLTGMLVNFMMFDTDGWLVKIQEADATEVSQLMDPFKFFKAGRTFNQIIQHYRRPDSYLLRKQSKRIM